MLSPGHPQGWFSYLVGYAKCDKIVQEILETTAVTSVLLKTLIGHESHDSDKSYFIRPGQGSKFKQPKTLHYKKQNAKFGLI